MKNKKIVGLIITMIFILIIGGCSTKDEIVDQIANDKDQDLLAPNDGKNQYMELMTTEELKEMLMESIGIELRNTENEAIGLLKDREVILQFVEEIFTYPKQEDFPNDSSENEVIGPIQFYFSNDDDLYGLVKENYIYIDGYYFILSERNNAKIVNLFKNNILQAPVSGN